MDIFIPICLLNLIAIVIIAVVSGLTYYFFFIKYKEKFDRKKENDINKGTIRLKYCLNCGEELQKKNFCKKCKTKY